MKRMTVISILTVLLALLVACGGEEEAPTPTVAPVEATGDIVFGSGETLAIGGEGGETYTFVVDTPSSQASYIVNEEFFADALSKLGISPGKRVVIGTTPGVSGQLELNFGNPDLVEGATFTVDMTGLATDQDQRDEWLQDNAIATATFAESTFVATGVTGLPASYTTGQEISFQLTGDLTVRDMTRSVTFDVTAVLANDVIVGTAVLPVQLTDFGIDPPDFANTLTVADPFRIEIQLQAVRQ